ncbi:MAG TPA: LysR family transcriptional regulator [Solirubrobacteraceae bacterium]|nr:LysR family transcriptional regulator [Solirubrobacteraceae bacterium]
MELRHLRTLDAIARHGSFTRAAEELHLAQSALSQQVRRLEAELGVDLLRRTSRSVAVTEAGQVVLDYARRVLSEVDGLQAELDELTGVLRGKVSIGAMWPTGTYDLPGVLGEFHGRHEGVDIHLMEDTADHLLDLLRRDELDCAFASVDPDRLGDEFAATKLFEEDMVIIAEPGHKFGSQEHVTLAELAEETLIAYREGSELRRRIEELMARESLTPRNAFHCTEMTAVRALATRGLGVAVLPRSIAALPGPPVVTAPVGPTPFTWPVSLVWRGRRRQPPAAKAFLQIALEAAATQSDVLADLPHLRVA